MRNSGVRGSLATRVIFLALLVGLLAMTATAQTSSAAAAKKTDTKAAATQTAPAADPSAGLRVFIDPVTHKPYTPSADDVKALENATTKKTLTTQSQPKAFANPRGGIAVKLDDSFMSYAVAGKDANGKVQSTCVEGDAKAQKIVESGKVPAPKATKKEVADEK